MRPYLKAAREKKELDQQMFADRIGVTRPTVSLWENTDRQIRKYYMETIREVLNNYDANLFMCDGETRQESNENYTLPPCETVPNRDTVNSDDSYLSDNIESSEETDMDSKRRQINAAFATLAKFGLVSGTGVISALPIISPETYIQQSSQTISACKELINSGKYGKAQDTLNAYIPTLMLMATMPTEYSQRASFLMAQAKLLQMRLTGLNCDYLTRESLCAEAVYFAKLSGNTRLQATAMTWQGDTFTYCYRQPQRAIPIFTNALQIVENDARLNRSHLLIDLSIAHAQRGNKDETVEFARQAQILMPEHPELDPFYQILDMGGQSELDQFEGKAYLFLSEQFAEYAELAYNSFGKSIDNQASHQGYRCQAHIYKADATIILDSLPKFVEHFTEGLGIAVDLDSKGNLTKAHDVLSRIPERWQNETPILKLKKDLALARTCVI